MTQAVKNHPSHHTFQSVKWVANITLKSMPLLLRFYFWRGTLNGPDLQMSVIIGVSGQFTEGDADENVLRNKHLEGPGAGKPNQ